MKYYELDVCCLTRLRSPAPLSSPVYDDCFRRDGEESPSKRVPPRRSRGHHPNVEDSDDNGDGDDSPPHADDDHIHNFRTPGSPNYRAKADSSPSYRSKHLTNSLRWKAGIGQRVSLLVLAGPRVLASLCGDDDDVIEKSRK